MSERPWIEWRGGPCPVAKGTLVDVIYADGRVQLAIPALTNSYFGEQIVPRDERRGCSWRWTGIVSCIIAYRIHSDDAKEAETRQARIDQFRKIADSGKWDIAPVKAPAKERV